MAPLYLCPLCPLCEKKRLPDDLYFHAKGAKGAKFLFPFLLYSTLALEESQTSLRQESAESLSTTSPLRGYSRLSQGENGPPQSPCRGRSHSQPTCVHTILTVPLRQVGRAKRRGGLFSPFRFHFSVRHRLRHPFPSRQPS